MKRFSKYISVMMIGAMLLTGSNVSSAEANDTVNVHLNFNRESSGYKDSEDAGSSSENSDTKEDAAGGKTDSDNEEAGTDNKTDSDKKTESSEADSSSETESSSKEDSSADEENESLENKTEDDADNTESGSADNTKASDDNEEDYDEVYDESKDLDDENDKSDKEDSTDESDGADEEKLTEEAEESDDADLSEDKDEKTEENEKAAWTVYIYMIGGSNESEEGLASANLDELVNAEGSDDVQFLVQAGGAKEWNGEDNDLCPNPDKTQRYLVKGGEVEKVYEDDLTDMAESDTLRDFITWGVSEYPSDKSMLIIYGEGDGSLYLGTDEIYGDTLTIPDIKTALADAGAGFDVMAFDACYMADLDVLNCLSSYADYFVASESVIANEGFDYEELVNVLSMNPECRASYAASKICDAYYEECRLNDINYMTLSVVESDKLGSVVDAAAAYVDELTEVYTGDQSMFAQLLVNDTFSGEYNTDSVRDLVGLAEKSEEVIDSIKNGNQKDEEDKDADDEDTDDSDSDSDDAAASGDDFADIAVAVEDAVRDAVVYKITGTDTRYNNGISFTYGFTLSSYWLDVYERIAAIPEYIALLDALKYDYHPDQALYDECVKLPEAERESFKAKLELVNDDDKKSDSKNKKDKDDSKVFADAKVTRGCSNIISVDYVITQTDDAKRVFTIQERSDCSYKGNFEFGAEFDGSIASLDGHAAVLEVDIETLDGAYYNIPVSVMNSDGEYEDRMLYVFYQNAWLADDGDEQSSDEKQNDEVSDDGSNPYQIIGLHKLNYRQTLPVSYDFEELSKGTKIRMAYPEKGRDDYLYGDEFEITNESSIEMTALTDGTYSLAYTITDGFGDSIESDGQTFYMADGKLSMTNPNEEESEETSSDDGNSGETEESTESEDSSENDDNVLDIVSYEDFYGEEMPARLRDIHYSAEASDEEDEDNAESNETETADEELTGEDADTDKADADDSSREEPAAEDVDESESKADVTMLCYICGADLESTKGAGSDVLRYANMAAGGDNVNIVFETGGAAEWKCKGLDPDSIQRFVLRDKKLVELSNVPVYNMSTATAFSEFLDWGVSNFPAEHYIVYAFDHGGAWLGTCWDSNFDSSHLSLKDWQYALESTGVTFDNIIFDECLMASVEVAAGVAPYAKYMTAYEESQMSLDYDWSKMFEYLYRHAESYDPVQFGKTLIDMNATAWEESAGNAYFQTMSLIDLSRIASVTEAFDEYSLELTDMLDNDIEAFTETVREIEQSRSYSYAFQKDLGNMMEKSSEVSYAARRKVLNAVDNVVLYKRSSYDQMRNNGLTVFFDMDSTFSRYDTYAGICPMKNYLVFIDRSHMGWHAPSGTYTDSDVVNTDLLAYKTSFDVISNDDNTSGISIKSGDDAVYQKSYQILRYDEEQGRYYKLATRNDFDEEDDVYYEKFDGRVASVNGHRCYLKFSSIDKDRVIYSVPVKHSDMSMSLKVAYYPSDGMLSDDMDIDNGKYTIIGIASDSPVLDAGTPEKSIKLVNYGDEITFTFPEVSEDGKELYSIEGDTITYDENLEFGFTTIDDGDYILRYNVKNALFETESSDDISITVRNARVYINADDDGDGAEE